MRALSRRGWSLHEMLISLCVMGIGVALASQISVGLLRFFRRVGDAEAASGKLGDVAGILSAVLWGMSPASDLIAASDSAIEVRAAIGGSVACSGTAGAVVVPAAAATGFSLSGFTSGPDAGDALDAFIEDSAGAGWIRATVSDIGAASAGCAAFGSSQAISLVLREPVIIPTGSILRFARPMRLSHYRASDGLWYFGVRDWNGALQRFNTVQPAVGPLEAHSADAAKSGLVISYLAADGSRLEPPLSAASVAAVQVRVRAPSSDPSPSVSDGRRVDSLVVTVGFRNRP